MSKGLHPVLTRYTLKREPIPCRVLHSRTPVVLARCLIALLRASHEEPHKVECAKTIGPRRASSVFIYYGAKVGEKVCRTSGETNRLQWGSCHRPLTWRARAVRHVRSSAHLGTHSLRALLQEGGSEKGGVTEPCGSEAKAALPQTMCVGECTWSCEHLAGIWEGDMLAPQPPGASATRPIKPP